MPLVSISVLKGWSETDKRLISDQIHRGSQSPRLAIKSLAYSVLWRLLLPVERLTFEQTAVS